MAANDHETLMRLICRAVNIRRTGTHNALGVAGPLMEQAAAAYGESARRVRIAKTADRTEREKRDETMGILGGDYDLILSCVLAQMPGADLPARASQMPTPENLLNGAQAVVDFLLTLGGVDEAHPIGGQGEAAPAGQPWLLTLVEGFMPKVASAVEQHAKAVAAGETLQKSIENRAQKRVVVEEKLHAFRKVVKDIYGRRSHEYRSLRDRAKPERDEVPTPPPAPEETALAAA